IGMFDAFAGPIEARTRDFGIPYRKVPSDLSFARYLIERGLDEGVDWAVIESWDVDHGFMVPMFKLDPQARHPMVPMFINCASPSFGRPRPPAAVGAAPAEGTANGEPNRRFALTAPGGLPHSAGALQQGFRGVVSLRRFLADFCAGRGDALAKLSDDEIAATG